MDKIILSSQEIMCLCAALGTDKVFGIADGFADVPINEISAKVQETTDGLMEKGLVEMDFTGNTKISSEAKKLMSVIGNSKNMLTVQVYMCDTQTAKAYVFYKEKNTILCSEQCSGGYSLGFISYNDLKEILSEYFSDRKTVGKNKYIADIDVNLFKKAAVSDYKTALSVLSECSLEEPVSQTLAKSFSKEADSFSMIAIPAEASALSVEGLALISCGEIMLDLKPNMPDFYNDEETVIISQTTVAEAQNKIENLLMKFGFSS